MDTAIRPKRLTKGRVAAIAGCAALAGLLIWALTAPKGASYTTDADGLLTATARRGVFDDYIRLSGTVESAVSVQLPAREGGIVERIYVEEGATVSEGDIILTLSNPDLRQEILSSESQLAERENMLRDTELAMEKERLQIRRDILAARMEMQRRKRERDRQKTLYEEKLTPREDWLKADEDYRLSVESLRLLESRERQDSFYRAVQVGNMRESLRNMQENMTLVRRRSDNLNVRAPRGGQLGRLAVELGQSIAAGQQIGQINTLGGYKVQVMVDEHYIDRVATGQEGKAVRGRDTVALRVAKVYPEVDKGRFKADLSIVSALPANIRVGQNYPVDLRLGESSEALLIPRGSFFNVTGGRWIFVVAPDGKSATRREIAIGRQNQRYYEVTGGLEPGERVILGSYQEYGDAKRLEIRGGDK